jgi:uncharacterized protein DUF5996
MLVAQCAAFFHCTSGFAQGFMAAIFAPPELGTIISRGTVSMNVLSTTAVSDLPECWPALPLNQWQDTCTTLHMWTQVVGKIRMELTPRVNHWWNVPLYVTP